MITNSEINGLSTLGTVFLSLSHAQLTGYSTGASKVDVKPTIYCMGLAFFIMEKILQNAWYFSDHLLSLIEIYLCFDVNQFNVFDCFYSEENK